MSRLTMEDMNSLNAIAGFLRVLGYTEAANILISIQGKATRLINDLEAINHMGDM